MSFGGLWESGSLSFSLSLCLFVFCLIYILYFRDQKREREREREIESVSKHGKEINTDVPILSIISRPS